MSSCIIIQLIYRLIFIGLEPPCGQSIDYGIYWLAHTSNVIHVQASKYKNQLTVPVVT